MEEHTWELLVLKIICAFGKRSKKVGAHNPLAKPGSDKSTE